MAHTEEDFTEILSAESFVEIHALAGAAHNGIPKVGTAFSVPTQQLVTLSALLTGRPC